MQWRLSVGQSAATQALIRLQQSTADGKLASLCAYYLGAKEQWARSYAQWIALRSNDPVLLGQIERILSSGIFGYEESQWQNEKFGPIALAIDEIFRHKGWLNEQ